MERVTGSVGRNGGASKIIGEQANRIWVIMTGLYDKRVQHRRFRVTDRQTD